MVTNFVTEPPHYQQGWLLPGIIQTNRTIPNQFRSIKESYSLIKELSGVGSHSGVRVHPERPWGASLLYSALSAEGWEGGGVLQTWAYSAAPDTPD